jgi:hypothetical protein
MAKRKQDEVIGVITPHQGRRILGAGLIGVLGIILLSVAVRFPPVDIPWLIFLIVLGIGCIVLSWKLWGATATTIELTRLELRAETWVLSVEEYGTIFQRMAGRRARLMEMAKEAGRKWFCRGSGAREFYATDEPERRLTEQTG